MKTEVVSTSPQDLACDILLFFVDQQGLDSFRAEFGELFNGARDALDGEFEAEQDESLLAFSSHVEARRIGVIGLGPRNSVDEETLREAAAKGVSLSDETDANHLAVAVPDVPIALGVRCRALAEGVRLAGYRFNRYKTDSARSSGLDSFTLQVDPPVSAPYSAVRQADIVSDATCRARDLVNLSPNEKTAEQLAGHAQTMARESGLECEIWDENRIRKENLGGLLAVNRGSVEPPTFTVLRWEPPVTTDQAPVVVVGKGVVFDTGGLSLKSTKGSMDKMKSDMAGAAAVIGILEAVARLELTVPVIGLIPATDNRPGENAYVPGDVLTMHSGATVEVMNTDAEGRLILADALSYAREFDPQLVIDLATLTGSQVVALGSLSAAIFGASAYDLDRELELFEEVGRASGEWVARLPMHDEYKELLDSPIADVRNVGGRAAGAIIAAKFLEHFTDYPWIHLDIAGPAFLDESRSYRPKGGTGFGVRLVTDFLTRYGGQS